MAVFCYSVGSSFSRLLSPHFHPLSLDRRERRIEVCERKLHHFLVKSSESTVA